MSSTYRYKLPLIKSGMYIKIAVITVLHNYFYHIGKNLITMWTGEPVKDLQKTK